MIFAFHRPFSLSLLPLFSCVSNGGSRFDLIDSFSNPKVSIASQSFFRAGDRWRGGTGGIACGPSRKRTLDESDVAGNFVQRTCVHLVRTSTEKCEKIDRRKHLYGKEVRFFKEKHERTRLEDLLLSVPQSVGKMSSRCFFQVYFSTQLLMNNSGPLSPRYREDTAPSVSRRRRTDDLYQRP